jgi:hypothetical protein
MSAELEKAYNQLLKDYGLEPPSPCVSKSRIAEVMNEFIYSDRRSGHGDRISDHFRDIEDTVQRFLESPEGFQQVLDAYSKEIEGAVRILVDHYNSPLTDIKLLVREFPTGSFNAQAKLVPGGALILLNTGLMKLLHKAIKLMMLSMPRVEIQKGKPQDWEAYRTIYRSDYMWELEYTEVVALLVQLIIAYLGGNFSYARQFPSEGGLLGALTSMLLSSCETFAIAHEYGHALKGHLMSPQTMFALTPVGEVEFVTNSHREELQADLLAAQLMIMSVPRDNDEALKFAQFECAAAGPAIFFALDRLVTKVQSELVGQNGIVPVYQTHPTSDQRAEMIRLLYRNFRGDSVLTLADQYSWWISAVGEDALSFIRGDYYEKHMKEILSNASEDRLTEC